MDDPEVQRIRRLDDRLSRATAKYAAARYRTQQLVANMESTLDSVQPFDLHQVERHKLWSLFRETTVKWIRCLRGQTPIGHELTADLDRRSADGALSSRPDVVENVRPTASRESVRHRKRPRVFTIRRLQAGRKRRDNMIAKNIRRIRDMRMRSCMRLPKLTPEEIETIDAIIKEGALETIAAVTGVPEADHVNPYGLSAADRQRMRVLNDALADVPEKRPTGCKVRFSENVSETIGERPGMDWTGTELNQSGLTEDNLADKNMGDNDDENFIDVKAHRIVNYAFGTYGY